MIRPATVTLLAVAILAGGLLFHVSYDARALNEELTSLNRQIQNDIDEMHVLRAEWSYLNEPVRLDSLSRRHLGLEPISSSQVVKLEMLPMRKSMVVAPITERPLIEDATRVTPEAAIISVDELAVTVRPQPKPSAPPRVMVGHESRVATRSLDDVLAEFLSQKSAR